MTQHVRTSYRNHRKAAWGLALLFVAAIATVTIPLASGAPSKTLRFTTQPPTPWQTSTPQEASVSVAVFSGGQNPLNSSPPPTPSISANCAIGVDSPCFDVSAPSYSGGYWTWRVTPRSNAPSGIYTFSATLGTLAPATSDPFRLVQYICQPSDPPSCDGTSNLGSSTLAPGKLRIANTLKTSVLLDFQTGLNPVPPGCNNDPDNPNDGAPHTWNRLFIDANGDGTPEAYFPAVALGFNFGDQDKMLQVTYMVRNSDWVLTNAARGNNDIELCAVAQHQTQALNNGEPANKFAGKYGPSTWDPDTKTYSGVLTTVANASKVKTDPAICGRGNFVDAFGVTWRAWTVCIPPDWDWGMG